MKSVEYREPRIQSMPYTDHMMLLQLFGMQLKNKDKRIDRYNRFVEMEVPSTKQKSFVERERKELKKILAEIRRRIIYRRRTLTTSMIFTVFSCIRTQMMKYRTPSSFLSS